MHIDEYRFGSMVVDGEAHRSDLILLPEGIRARWWRAQGHRLDISDLDDLFDARPEVLVIGTGASGLMEVPEETRRALLEAGIQPLIEPTEQAVRRYNDLAAAGRRVAGAFHLTC